MFQPRRIQSEPTWSDPAGIKIYTISASGRDVDQSAFAVQLAAMKTRVPIDWSEAPAFAIFHEGAGALYLVLVWWGNDNELFIRVAVREPGGWVSDMSRYSFCLWDLEIMWHERQFFIDTIYCAEPDLAAYRLKRYGNV